MSFDPYAYDTYLFDCDGVILDSNKVKTDVFYEVALQFADQEAAEHLRQYHMRSGGVSRFKKFEYFFGEYLKETDYQARLEKSLSEFKRISLQSCCQCEYVPGVLDFLGRLKSAQKAFVVSGGAEADLAEIFKVRNIDHYFAGIFGSPKSKYEIVDSISPQGKTLFLGDSKLDFEVAKNYGFDFLFISGVSEWKSATQELAGEAHFSAVDFTTF